MKSFCVNLTSYNLIQNVKTRFDLFRVSQNGRKDVIILYIKEIDCHLCYVVLK